MIDNHKSCWRWFLTSELVLVLVWWKVRFSQVGLIDEDCGSRVTCMEPNNHSAADRVTYLRLVLRTACIRRARGRRLLVPNSEQLPSAEVITKSSVRKAFWFLGQSLTLENLQPGSRVSPDALVGSFMTTSQFLFILLCIISSIFPSPPSFSYSAEFPRFFFPREFYLCDHLHLRPCILSYILFYTSLQIIPPMFFLLETSRWGMLEGIEIIYKCGPPYLWRCGPGLHSFGLCNILLVSTWIWKQV